MLSHAIRSCLNFSQYKFHEEFFEKTFIQLDFTDVYESSCYFLLIFKP